MISGACEFLEHYEAFAPLPHAGYYKKWALDAIELWKIQVSEETDDLMQVLKLRKVILDNHSLPSSSPVKGEEENTWKWLLTTKQIEQRTAEWYNETSNIITASEISYLWKGPRSRASLVMSKVSQEEKTVSKRNAVRREDTGPMDWGVRYEPVVKQILEDTLGAKIQELGRIRHRTVPRVAASPDGLFIECEKNPELVGTLVEIKCPPSRVINDKIPFDYWCQMQLQMEVCDRPSCEFVEVKFKELAEGGSDAPLNGWISLECNPDTMDMRYSYSSSFEKGNLTEGWVLVEKYQWEVVKLRRVTLLRDPTWFQSSQGDLDAFWKDVEDARAGKWEAPPRGKEKEKKVEKCAIVDSGSDKEVSPSIPVAIGSDDSSSIAKPVHTGDI
jgi:putative phage-type endonuclease